jgi:hypothetical protein
MHTLFIIILVLTSVVAVAFIVERSLALRWNKVIPPEVRYTIQAYQSPAQLQQVRRVCEYNPSAPVAVRFRTPGLAAR